MAVTALQRRKAAHTAWVTLREPRKWRGMVDVVEIDAGTYEGDAAVWRANTLTRRSRTQTGDDVAG